jgi:hypothetical protein
MSVHYFTFGQVHTADIDLPRGGRLSDYWVAVDADSDHRKHFIEQFTSQHCPRPMQFATEYTDDSLKIKYFPKGELKRIVI